MRNVTITLDEEVARWARILAAERDTSVSKLVGEMLRDTMHMERARRAAMDRYLGRDAAAHKSEPGYPPRDELHDRDGLR